MKKLSFLFAALVAGMFGLSANAEVLVYEGFGSSDYNIGSGQSDQGTANNYPVTSPLVDAIGVGDSKSKWAGMGGSQIKVYGSYRGLDLPAAMKNAGFTAIGGAIGLNNGADNSDLRAMNHALTASLNRSEGKLYLRMLLCIDAKAAGKLIAGDKMSNKSGGYYGFGVMKKPSGNDYYMLSQWKSPSAIGFAIWKNNDSQYVLSLALTDASGTSSNYPIVTGIAMDTTYVCYAEIDIGADGDAKEIVKAGAMASEDYSQLLTWQQKDISIQLMTDSAYPDCMAVMGPYGSNGGFFRADEIRIGTAIADVLAVNSDGPELGDVTLSERKGDGSYDVTIEVAANAGTVKAIARTCDDDPAPIVVASAAEVSAPNSETLTLSGFAADKTYQILAAVENASGVDTNKVGAIYSGALSLVKVRDADEYRCVPGEVTVSRATADPYPLTVNYTFTSEAAGAAPGKTWVAPEPIVIPANERSAIIRLTPIVDMSIAEDITVTLSITVGNYPEVAQNVDLVIKNLVAPEGYNTWVAVTPGKASTAANWSEGRPPIPTDKVLFDGDFSSADCEWDGGVNGLSDTVAEWNQLEGFTGTVTIDTTYQEASGTFTRLTVNGDVKILGGKWTHPVNDTSIATYHLDVKVTGDFNLATGAAIDCRYKGFTRGKKYPNSNIGQHGGSASALSQARDSVYFPKEIGNGGNVGNGVSIGGGAVWLDIGGAMTMNGDIDVHAWENTGGWGGDGSGAPGAVYISAKSVTGSGTIHAEAPKVDRRGTETPSGGRVAIYLTEATELGISPTQNILYFGALSSNCAGAGTLFVKTAADTYGTLYIKNFKKNPGHTCGINYHTFTATTPILAGETWTFDRIVLGEEGSLCVPEGTTLVLPNGFKSVEGDGMFCGILYQGGNIVLGDGDAVHTIQNNWIFHANAPYTFDRDVVVKNGAAIGQLRFYNNMTTLSQCNVMVNGDLTVEETGYLWARNTSMVNSGNFESDFASRPAGTYCHAGLVGAYALDVEGNTFGLTNATYGSIFNPSLGGTHGPGNDGANMNNGGGLLILNVTGDFVLDGLCDASGGGYSYDGNASKGSGGSVNITAKSLSGKGSITADGTRNSCATEENILSYFFPRTSNKTRSLTTCTGGGRIAVKLTGADAVFTEEWKAKITAVGASRNNSNKEISKYAMSSAGTVYLETAANGAKGGEIIIRNDGCADNDLTVTPIPAMTQGDAASDFMHHASLTIGDCGRVLLNADLAKMSTLTMSADTKLCLNGKTLTVNTAKLGGVKLKPGTYAASDYPGFLTGGGSLVVKGTGLMLLVR